MTLRVVQFSTGNVGVHALRQIIESPHLELVGVHASSPAKVGRDAGELCGLGPTGVLATDDVGALVVADVLDCSLGERWRVSLGQRMDRGSTSSPPQRRDSRRPPRILAMGPLNITLLVTPSDPRARLADAEKARHVNCGV
jgi:hypothetical protein